MPLVLFLFLLLLQLKQSVALLFPFLLTSLFPLQLILLLLKFKRLLRFRAYSIFQGLLFFFFFRPFWVFLYILYIGFNRRTAFKVLVMPVVFLLHLIILWFSPKCHLRCR